MMENLCPCPANPVDVKAQQDAELRAVLTGTRKIEKRVKQVENVHPAFVTKLFQNKSTPYPERFE